MMCAAEIHIGQEYICNRPLNLYKTAIGESLVTQARAGRHLQLVQPTSSPAPEAVKVVLCEDDYAGWLPIAALEHLTLAPVGYCPPCPSPAAIRAAIPQVIRFAKTAMQQPNTYLWGGTVGPDYDCSGLVQAAFAAAGIMLPRDSYQQQTFVEPITLAQLEVGDLLFFGTRDRITHVALYLEDGKYIHSSGKEQGRNGIGIDSITDLTDPISWTYYQQLQGAGRVSRSYQPTGRPMRQR